MKRFTLHQFLRVTAARLFLLWLAWQAIAGGIRQMPRSRTTGQKVETVLQLDCGFLSLLTLWTSFHPQRWARPVQTAWSVSLAAASGLSSLVWGPPMPGIGLLFSAIALLVARIVRGALHLDRGINSFETKNLSG